ncbi:hypothetical protein JCM33374_g150 [Metschnikowia sp. JCM 33374]|nr:hypothetical protein JCM33374_g150 [Metschnikowia sp. JCM 33374]
MEDTEFTFGDSILFSNTQSHIEPQAAPVALDTNQSEDVDVEFSSSLLFPQQSNSSPSTATLPLQDPSFALATPVNKSKKVKLLNGSTISLKPRRRKEVDVDFSDDPNSIINMDRLYERVNQREKLRVTQEQIQNLKKQKKQETVKSPQLWSEKYKPRSFLQICPAGNERQYRLVMHWLRKWGTVVFGHAKDEGESVDHLGRPLRKILLVHGPPGIGKTAVVHLLAQQMGYSIEELNAANSMNTLHGMDSAEGAGRFANATAALKLKVRNALTTNSITSNGKPTCLIIDEIDSTINTGDIVKVISELVRTDQINNRKKEGQDTRRDTRKKSNQRPFYLNRPIICIANDIYNTSARSGGPNPMEALRPFCEIVAFRRPATGSSSHGTKINSSAQKSVKEFLMKINEQEKLGLDRKEIAEVFEICDGDIRACINYLQFSSRKLDTDIHSFAPAGSPGIVNKDSSISWFTLVDQIFRRNQGLSKEENFEEMLDLVSSGDGKSAATGSLDKVIRGCFNKYLDVVHLQDDSPVRPAEISDWLYYYDLLTSQNLTSNFYPTLTTLKFWSLFSDINPQKFRDVDGLIPDARNLDFSSREALKQNNAVVKKLADSIPLNSKVSLCGTSSRSAFYACEFIPLLDKMLSPEVGSSKSKISLKTHEVNMIEKLSGFIKALDIKLESQRDIETNQVYLVYGPDWEGITIFGSGEQNCEHKKRILNVKRQWLFPLLQSELESLSSTGLLKRQRAELQEKEKHEAKQKRTKMTSSLDFFKGQYDDISNKIATASKPVNREATRIWVKHHEGFSNAVRKNIGWYELWH